MVPPSGDFRLDFLSMVLENSFTSFDRHVFVVFGGEGEDILNEDRCKQLHRQQIFSEPHSRVEVPASYLIGKRQDKEDFITAMREKVKEKRKMASD